MLNLAERSGKQRQRPLYSHLNTQHVVTCCERLHTSANIAQQETTMLAQQCYVLFRAFARALRIQLQPDQDSRCLNHSQSCSPVERKNCRMVMPHKPLLTWTNATITRRNELLPVDNAFLFIFINFNLISSEITTCVMLSSSSSVILCCAATIWN